MNFQRSSQFIVILRVRRRKMFVQKDINVIWQGNNHLKIQMVKILLLRGRSLSNFIILNLNVKSVKIKENVKTVLMSAYNVDILRMKNALRPRCIKLLMKCWEHLLLQNTYKLLNKYNKKTYLGTNSHSQDSSMAFKTFSKNKKSNFSRI